MLGAQRIVISTNAELRQDGFPYSNRRAPEDVGVAVYFTLEGRPYVLPCDKWERVADNLAAIAKHVEAKRGCRVPGTAIPRAALDRGVGRSSGRLLSVDRAAVPAARRRAASG